MKLQQFSLQYDLLLCKEESLQPLLIDLLTLARIS